MRFSGKPKVHNSDEWLSEKYTMQMIEPKHKDDVIKYACLIHCYLVPATSNNILDLCRIIADSFYEKADLEHWLEPRVPYSEYTNLLELLWESLLEKDLR